MLRRLAAALLVLALAPAALAEDSQCMITYENNSGTKFQGQASLWKGDTLQIGDTTYTDANGHTYDITVDNDSSLLIQAVDSKECDIIAYIASKSASAALKSEVEATGSSSETKCYEDDENNFQKKYGCSCTHDKGAHHAEITMTCDGSS